MHKPSKLIFRDALIVLLFLKVFILLLMGFLHFFESLNPIEKALSTLDFRDLYYHQNEHFTEPDNKNIVIINTGSLTDSSVGGFRQELSDVINQINIGNPSVLAVDILFDKNSNDPIADALLIENLTESSRLIMATDSSAEPGSIEISNANKGDIRLSSDSLNAQRFYPIKEGNDFKLKKTFALEVTQAIKPSIIEELDQNNFEKDIEIDFRYHPWKYNNLLDTTPLNPNYFDVIEASAFLDSNLLEKIKQRSLIKDKIVLIAHISNKDAGNLYDIEDRHIVPHANSEIIDKRPISPGIFIHAEVIQMFLNNRVMNCWPNWFIAILENTIIYLVALGFCWIAARSIWFKPIVIPLVFILCFAFIWASLILRDNLLFWTVGSLNIQIILLIETIEFYEPIAHWLHKKYKFQTFFSHE